MEILAFLNGLLFAYSSSFLSLLLLILALWLKAARRIVVWFLAAYLWAMMHQWLVRAQGIPDVAIIQRAQISGEVVSIPSTTAIKTEFQFLVHTFNHHPAHSKVLLQCYIDCPVFEPGTAWEFEVKLKKPSDLANLGAMSWVNKMLANHIAWTGYLKPGTYHRLPIEKSWRLAWQSARFALAKQLSTALNNQESTGIVQALGLGITTQISKAQWDLFRRTGTTHLMVISGAHIGLVSSLLYAIGLWLWRFSQRLCLFCPAQQAASYMAMLGGVIYAFLAGFAVPAQRAVIVGLIVFGRNVGGRYLTAWQAWRYALLAVLCMEPHAVLQPGFYLSFMAVAVLLLIHKRFDYKRIKQYLLMQVACVIGLLPMTCYWFSYTALIGVIANLFAIPWVGFCIVPLTLLQMLLMPFVQCSWIEWLLKSSIHYLFMGLSYVDSLAWLNLSFSLSDPILLLIGTMVCGVLFLLPIRSLFPLCFVMIGCLSTTFHPRPQYGAAWVDVLDVGQGLAVVVQTAKHVLLYDTGMRFYQGSDMGTLALLPFFRQQGIQHLDAIVISHPDLDHRGGLESIESQLPSARFIVNDPGYYHRGWNCHDYPDWDWDGVHFSFFSIASQNLITRNDNSCVLQMSAGQNRALLSGDIEAHAEHYLVNRYHDKLRSDILVVPHHGSKTSSSVAFIHQVHPRYALISSGLDNRYHFPHPQTLQTLGYEGSRVLNTMEYGMIRVILEDIQQAPQIYTYMRVPR